MQFLQLNGQGTIKYFKTHTNSFFNSCIMPIIGYGAELYSATMIQKLELIRIQCLKDLFSNKYRYPEIRNQFLDMEHYQALKLLSLNL